MTKPVEYHELTPEKWGHLVYFPTEPSNPKHVEIQEELLLRASTPGRRAYKIEWDKCFYREREEREQQVAKLEQIIQAQRQSIRHLTDTLKATLDRLQTVEAAAEAAALAAAAKSAAPSAARAR